MATMPGRWGCSLSGRQAWRVDVQLKGRSAGAHATQTAGSLGGVWSGDDHDRPLRPSCCGSRGGGINYLFVSDETLYLPIVSLFPKILLLVALWLLLRWVDHHKAENRNLLYLTLGVPAVLFMGTTDYLAYMGTFYQEPASFIYLLAGLGSLLFLARKPTSSVRFLVCVGLFFLLSSAKASNIYWSVIGVASAGLIWRGASKVLRTGLTVGVILLVGFLSREITRAGTVRVNAYHSLFYGVLTFSNNPPAQLDHLGFDAEARNCVGIHAYVRNCCFQHRRQVRFSSALQALLQEPLIAFRMLGHSGINMQDISLEYLAHRSKDHPAYEKPLDYLVAGEQRFRRAGWGSILNLWSTLKFVLFPTGAWLWIAG